MRHDFSPPRPAWAQRVGRYIAASVRVVVLGALASCGGATASITLALDGAPGSALDDVSALRVLVRERDQDSPAAFGPFDLDREQPTRLEAEVTPGTPFYVDVWGCGDTESCAPDSALARGCSEVLTLETDERAVVTVLLFELGQGGPLPPCPPAWEEE